MTNLSTPLALALLSASRAWKWVTGKNAITAHAVWRLPIRSSPKLVCVASNKTTLLPNRQHTKKPLFHNSGSFLICKDSFFAPVSHAANLVALGLTERTRFTIAALG